MESISVEQKTATTPTPDKAPRKGANAAVPRLEGDGTSSDNAEMNLEETQAAATSITPPRRKKEQKEKPYCACGCGNRLTSSNPNRIFLQGHDAKCKKALRQVADGEESPRSIHRITVENRAKMNFLKKDADLNRAMNEAVKAHNMK